MVVHGGEDVDDVRVLLVDEEALLEDRLVVEGKRQAAGVERARAFEVARLGLEHIVDAVAVLVDPFADGVAAIARLRVLRPVAPVGEDAAQVIGA